MATFGEIIKARRIELGLSCNELAGRIPIAQPALFQIENDTVKPRPLTLRAICWQLMLDVDTLMPLPPHSCPNGDLCPCCNWWKQWRTNEQH